MSKGNEEEITFWGIIESRIGCNVPTYVKNLLRLNGYENAISIKTITAEDIKVLSDYARSDEMKKRLPDNADPKDYFGSFWDSPKQFRILPGHERLLMEIVSYIRLALLSNGPNSFSVNTKTANNLATEYYCPSIPSPRTRTVASGQAKTKEPMEYKPTSTTKKSETDSDTISVDIDQIDTSTDYSLLRRNDSQVDEKMSSKKLTKAKQGDNGRQSKLKRATRKKLRSE